MKISKVLHYMLATSKWAKYYPNYEKIEESINLNIRPLISDIKADGVRVIEK